jgi:hypothetical protein
MRGGRDYSTNDVNNVAESSIVVSPRNNDSYGLDRGARKLRRLAETAIFSVEDSPAGLGMVSPSTRVSVGDGMT